MVWEEKLKRWKSSPNVPSDLKGQLDELDALELYDSFYRYLEFGTGGMRGEIGPGINRINVVMVRRVTAALAQYVIRHKGQNAGVVVAYDNRRLSKEFASETARVLAYYGIKVYLSDFIRPTPIVSLLVREYEAFAGVMITASHNPAQYNGYKIYGADGGQITLGVANELTKELMQIEDETALVIEDSSIDTHLIHTFSSEADDNYLSQLASVNVQPELIQQYGGELKVLYTPLHGSGQKLVMKGLHRAGFTNSYLVNEQADYDHNFATVTNPNPEEQVVFNLAIQRGQEIGADIILATDPDADRLGVAVRSGSRYELLNGNEIGVLMLNYLAKYNQEDNASVIKTIVTSDLGAKIVKKYDLNMIETLTGFKFIGEQIKRLEQNRHPFLFGYEESYGYLIQPYVRDKDAIQAALMIAEIALHSKRNHQTLLDALTNIYEEFGYYQEALVDKVYYGAAATQLFQDQMSYLHRNIPQQIGQQAVVKVQDYLISREFNYKTSVTSQLHLPQSDVLKLFLEDGSWVCIRPSGTEPKCKIYFSVNDPQQDQAIAKLEQLKRDFLVYFDEMSRILKGNKIEMEHNNE